MNSQKISLKEITDKIIIDSEMKNAYNNSVSLNYKMSGDFPVLSLGENNRPLAKIKCYLPKYD